MTHANINEVLDFCRRRGIPDLPKDARTVMRTERKAKLDSDRSFAHFGFEVGIRQAWGTAPVPRELKLHGNIVGLPLYKSSQVGLWPILCRITNIKASAPFMVSVYCGKGKPPNLQDYLHPFLEVSHLSSNGMVIKGIHVDVSLTAMVCDAPARSYVKAIIGHTGYHGCERCNQKGQHTERQVTFPDLYAPERTNASFRAQDDEHHPTGLSPFLTLNVDMVSLFPTEYMHLICLGVMRRLFRNWVCQGHRTRLIREQRNRLDEGLRQSAMSFPSCFQRKPRGTEELDRWKATEFRTFMLYVGPVLLRSLLTNKQYEHFLMFHVAVKILISPEHHTTYSRFARDLLRYFVQELGGLYGEKQLVYNVHSLIHLADQCLDHGPLDEFSAFPFESYLGKIKKELRSPREPLAQLSRRLSEVRDVSHMLTKEVQKSVKPGDVFMLNKSPVVVLEILQDSFKGGILPNVRVFFKVPMKSSELGVWRCDTFRQGTKVWPLSDIREGVQCVMLKYKGGHVILPLLHLN
ncbi:uncharacterized protein ISCGN_010173 [Ixodes scapularis]